MTNSEITPAMARELIQAAYKILEREGFTPPKSPCTKEAPSKGNARRAVGIAKNPYTGQYHYVQYNPPPPPPQPQPTYYVVG